MTELGTFGGERSEANAINATGVVVGVSQTSGNAASHAFVYSNSTMTDIGTLGGLNSTASGINMYGQIVGDSNTSVGSDRHAFVYSGNQMTDMTDLGLTGSYSTAAAINAAGEIVGYQYHQGNPQAFLYSHGVVTGIGFNSAANAINEGGRVVGYATFTSPAHIEIVDAFSYWGAVVTDLGNLGGPFGSVANGINDSGLIVGYSYVANSNRTAAFVYASEGMVNLNSLLPANSAWQLEVASSINNSGQIAGYGTINGQTHAFILDTSGFSSSSEAPEPATSFLGMFLLAGIGTSHLLRNRKYKATSGR